MDNTMKELQERMNKMEDRLDCIYVHVLDNKNEKDLLPVGVRLTGKKPVIEKPKPPQNNGFFIPEEGDKYWCKLLHGGVLNASYDSNSHTDSSDIMSGNTFRTKEQAEAFNREKHYERMEAWQLLNSYSDGWSEVEKNYVISINALGDILVEYVGYDNGAPATFRTTEKAQAVLDHLGEETIIKAYGRV